MSGGKLNLKEIETCFIIAEIGQNHQGDIKLAKTMIKIAKVRTFNNIVLHITDIC